MNRFLRYPALIVLFLFCSGCGKQRSRITTHEQHTVGSGVDSVQIRSVDFYSTAIARTAHYLIALPPDYDSKPTLRFPVLFLLHGMDGKPADWIEKGHLASLASFHHMVLVMPDGADSYYTNSVFRSKDRYEDFINVDLVNDVEQYFRVLQETQGRGIAGISMGGYGAVKIAMHLPDRYGFAAGLSAPLDVTQWPFAPSRLGQSMRLLRIFGFPGGQARRSNDVFLLAKQTQTVPFIYLTCGTSEGLLGVNRSFDVLLTKQRLTHEYHETPGVHSWDSWDSVLPSMIIAAEQHLAKPE